MQKEKIDPFINIKKRIEQYAINQRKVCAKYLGSTNPWLPVKPHTNVQYYYLDKSKKLGWCVNAKVSHDSNFKIKLYLVDSNNIGLYFPFNCKFNILSTIFIKQTVWIVNSETGSYVCFWKI